MEGFRFEFDATNRILRLSFLGDLTDRLLLEGYESARASWFRHGPFHFIVDYSAVSDWPVSSETIRAIASRHPVMTDNYLGIIVAPQNVLYGMSRMFEQLSTDYSPQHTRRSHDGRGTEIDRRIVTKIQSDRVSRNGVVPITTAVRRLTTYPVFEVTDEMLNPVRLHDGATSKTHSA